MIKFKVLSARTWTHDGNVFRLSPKFIAVSIIVAAESFVNVSQAGLNSLSGSCFNNVNL